MALLRRKDGQRGDVFAGLPLAWGASPATAGWSEFRGTRWFSQGRGAGLLSARPAKVKDFTRASIQRAIIAKDRGQGSGSGVRGQAICQGWVRLSPDS